MLMLTRKKNESFVISLGEETVKVMVTRIGVGAQTGKKEVQLGIEAPKQCRVWRSELFEAMSENRRAAGAQSSPKAIRKLCILK